MQKKLWLKRIVLFLIAAIIAALVGGFFLLKNLVGDMWSLAPYANELLGFSGEKNYLIIFQNNNELRPTGGFISAYGLLRLNKGSYKLKFADSYKLESVENLSPAPQPFIKLLKDDPNFKGWYFRDGNFNVDFPTSAKDLEKLYNEQSGNPATSFDGVFAVNSELLEDLVSIYNIEINNKKLDKQNLFALLEHEVKNIDTHNTEMLTNRKNILGELADKLINKIFKSISKYDDFFEIINTGLSEKKILLFFKNPEIQKIAEENAWSGSFSVSNYQNFIYTNIANIGGRKADRYVIKTHKYFVSFDENGLGKVKYTINLEHLGTKNLNSDIYKAYLRTFIPENEMFEDYIKIAPGEQKALTFEYLLPKDTTMENFVLDIVKQPGTKDFWQISIQLPADNSFRSEELDVRENLALWSGYLTKDKHFDFNYFKDAFPPLVLWQKFIGQNKIEIAFGEAVNEKFALNPENYKIEDLNYINNQTDEIKVKSVKIDDMKVILETEGISEANEERYSLILKNIEDKYQNKTSPDPLKLTVVQRF
ncbi:hypothetical protein A3B60_03325 [Candidatus Peregrinibacteria bacterium RIFCSPLOWO2_01_FULL_39_12]|nr:MAG: hypothetical protein A3I58_01605 [Candidatus Peregrinibacteria bacterium RIFCSPLOWO2_02_FULL_39_10]OGJ42172.1 MAG: hypothetical protein A3B60_03325 [Candidatus Peregrinibacteria bacterium RIFCSPLOWO2_01_FULL_39_12]